MSGTHRIFRVFYFVLYVDQFRSFTTLTLFTDAQCKHCKLNLKRKSGNTSAMTRHLEKHPQIAKNAKMLLEKKENAGKMNQSQSQPNIEIAFSKQALLDPKSLRSKRITKAIAHMIACDLQPYSIVEDRGFKNLITILEPRYQLPSRTTFSRILIPKIYQEERARITDIIEHDMAKGINRFLSNLIYMYKIIK